MRLSVGRDAPIWVYNLALAGAAFALWALVLRHMDSAPVEHISAAWWGLALVFYLAEAYVVHIQFRREAHTISLSEVGLVVGLYVLSPGGLLLAQLVGAAAALAFVRRQRAAKLVFNLAQLALTTIVAVLVFHGVARLGHPFGAAGWIGVLLAAVAASLVGILLVTIVIAIAERGLSVRQLPIAAGISIVATIGVSNLVLIAIELARADSGSIALLALPAIIGITAFHAFASQARRHEHLEFLYESMKATQGAPEFSLAVGQLLLTVRQLVRAEYAEIFLFGAGTELGLRSTLGSGGEMTAHPDTIGPADEQVLALLACTADSIVLPKARTLHSLDGYLAARNLPDGIVAVLQGEDGPFGMMVVGDRSGDVDSFNADDKRLLETFVGHASVMLENGRLERSLAEVTDLKERLRHQAFHDILTGLPNRALFTERVETAIQRGDGLAAVLFLDLDDFKGINDTLGHAVGDEVLAEVARRVLRSIRPADTAARLGGDEFAVLLDSVDRKGVEVVAETLLEAMQRPFSLHGRETKVHASIGVAPASSADSADELLRNADVAMYYAKGAGKHRFSHYEPTMHALVRTRHEFALELQGALERDEIGIVFEPIVNLRDGEIMAFEALARWYSADRGVVQPGEFIPVAEESNLMVQIGNSVLRQACAAARRWQDAYPAYRETGVSVNLSPSELANESLADDVARALFESRLSAEYLMLEITESDVMWDLDSAHLRMSELRALGVKLVLDDFGTGRSSLERLDTFPLDAVKIAKPFVDRLVDPACESSFIDAFVRLAGSLELQCIAEGIEHGAQVPRLLDRGCALGQGFHFAPPMAADELDAYLGAAGSALLRVG
ncbi:MAG TPA: EAL domain-containing protein [Gaiellaceae bacterium]